MPAPDPAVFAKALEGLSPTVADAQPASTTMLQTDTPPKYISIELPGEGNLWVEFSYEGTPAAEAWHWDQATLFTPIPPNKETVIASRKGDRLLCKLGFPEQKITLKWGYE
jgi:hypothetical protein